MTTIEQPIQNAEAITCNTTKTYLFTKEVYLAVKAHWVLKNTHDAAQHIGYNLIRGFAPTRGFTPIKSQNKIDSNNCDAWNGYNQARYEFETILTKATPRIYTPSNKHPYTPNEAAMAADKERTDKLNTQRAERFKAWFGIELTDEIRTAFPKLERM
jgi:hypothetical protein